MLDIKRKRIERTRSRPASKLGQRSRLSSLLHKLLLPVPGLLPIMSVPNLFEEKKKRSADNFLATCCFHLKEPSDIPNVLTWACPGKQVQNASGQAHAYAKLLKIPSGHRLNGLKSAKGKKRGEGGLRPERTLSNLFLRGIHFSKTSSTTKPAL